MTASAPSDQGGRPAAGAVRSVFLLVVAGLALAGVVVVLGAYTRLVDAGLGCPDWPGCYGGFGAPRSAAAVAQAEAAYPDAPVDAAKAWTEMVHRYAATALGMLIVAILIAVLRARLPWRLPLALLVLVVAQGAFGAWTVTLKLWPQVVTAHLLGGFATLAVLWLLAANLRPPDWRPTRPLRGPAALALAVVVAQVALGGWLTANYAGLACPDFPLCHGAWIPEMNVAEAFDVAQAVGPNYLGGLLSSDARVAIHFVHRVGAVAVVAAVGWLAWRVEHRPSAWLLAGLLAIQFGLGVANVLLALPLAVAVLHNAGAAALLLAVVAVNHAAWRRPVPAPTP